MSRQTISRKNSRTSLTGTEMSSDSDNDQQSTTASNKSQTPPQQLPRSSCMSVHTQQESLARTIDVTPRATADTLEGDDKEASTTTTTTACTTIGFAQVQIREYARRMGDNPGCRCGVSLTLDWDVQSEVSIDLDKYEETRPTRRDRSEMILPPEVRMQMMRDAGYARGEVLQYVKKANIARGQRARTNETLQLAGAQEMAQRFFKGVLNKSVRRKSKQLEKKTLAVHLQKDQEKLQKTPSGRNLLGRKSNRRASKDDTLESVDSDEVSASEEVEVVKADAEAPEFLAAPALLAVDKPLRTVVEVDC